MYTNNNHHQTPTYERCPDENRTGTLVRTSGGDKIVMELHVENISTILWRVNRYSCIHEHSDRPLNESILILISGVASVCVCVCCVRIAPTDLWSCSTYPYIYIYICAIRGVDSRRRNRKYMLCFGNVTTYRKNDQKSTRSVHCIPCIAFRAFIHI